MKNEEPQKVEKISDLILIVHPRISQWTARKKLRISDTKAQADELPPEDIANLGSKYMIDKKELKPFRSIYRRMHAACKKVGVSILGGYGVPLEAVPALRTQIAKCRADWNIAVAKFEGRLDLLVDEYREKHPEWAHMISDWKLNKVQIIGKFGFAVTYFSAAEPKEKEAAKSFQDEMSGMSGTLMREIADEVQNMQTTTFGNGKDVASIRSVKRLLALKDKMRGLSFLSPDIEPLCGLIEEKLNGMPVEGKITGQDFLMLSGIVSLMSSPARMQQAGQQLNEGNGVSADSWFLNKPAAGSRILPKEEVKPIASAPVIKAPVTPVQAVTF